MASNKLCKDNLICCDDDCCKCANRVYQSYLKLLNEMKITREFIHSHGLEFQLMAEYKKFICDAPSVATQLDSDTKDCYRRADK
jgi:hypothetical protein